jgi:hypothetical protein
MQSGRHAGHTPSVWPQAILFRIAVVRALDRRPRDRGHRRPPPGGLMHPITGDAEPPDTERSPAEISSPQPQATPGRPLSLQRGPLAPSLSRRSSWSAQARRRRSTGPPRPGLSDSPSPARPSLLCRSPCPTCRGRALGGLPQPRSVRPAIAAIRPTCGAQPRPRASTYLTDHSRRTVGRTKLKLLCLIAGQGTAALGLLPARVVVETHAPSLSGTVRRQVGSRRF